MAAAAAWEAAFDQWQGQIDRYARFQGKLLAFTAMINPEARASSAEDHPRLIMIVEVLLADRQAEPAPGRP